MVDWRIAEIGNLHSYKMGVTVTYAKEKTVLKFLSVFKTSRPKIPTFVM